MAKPFLEPLPRFTTIGMDERIAVSKSLIKPLSGYLGGIHTGGYWVERLQEEWKAAFQVSHAIACNSATSGLLAACMATGVGPGDEVWVTAYSMSATAACAKVLGAKVKFIDIEPYTLGLNPFEMIGRGALLPKALIVTNLHGNPARLAEIRSICDRHGITMIEVNAQSPFAMEGNRYAGTIGHIGVFSLNVHKHIQCGEGGVVVTDSPEFAKRLRDSVNHGELAVAGHTGLNLRMTEPIAAIACTQLAKAKEIIAGRVELANKLTEMIWGIDFLSAPSERRDCKHVYYMWCPLMKKNHVAKRDRFVELLQSKGFPIRAGYVQPLHRLFKSGDECPIADLIESQIISFEVCAYAPTDKHLKTMQDIIHWAAETVDGGKDHTEKGGR